MGPRKVHLHSLPLCQYSCLETQNRTDQLVYVYIYVTVEWQVRNLKGRQQAGNGQEELITVVVLRQSFFFRDISVLL